MHPNGCTFEICRRAVWIHLMGRNISFKIDSAGLNDKYYSVDKSLDVNVAPYTYNVVLMINHHLWILVQKHVCPCIVRNSANILLQIIDDRVLHLFYWACVVENNDWCILASRICYYFYIVNYYICRNIKCTQFVLFLYHCLDCLLNLERSTNRDERRCRRINLHH